VYRVAARRLTRSKVERSVTERTIARGRTEPRWPVILTLTLLVALIELLPGRYRLGPPWMPWTLYAIVVASMLAVMFAPTSIFWHRVERAVVLTFFILVCSLNLLAVLKLVGDMITHKHGFSSITLLESATVIWTVNVILFALLYWQLDRGGAEARAADVAGTPDFGFAQSKDAERPSGWEPWFVDYLFLAFTNSTSFTPPDHARPTSHRAKVLLMLQASISLATLFLIASRAIATLS
jgi:hypothetical protein